MRTSFKQTYIDALKQYHFIGGMPEAMQSFTEDKDLNEVREIQKRILACRPSFIRNRGNLQIR